MTCQGSGEITQDRADMIEAGQKLYRQRLNSGETLWEAAARQGMTSSQLSAIENGRRLP
jgi:transcriptional regulator with XRE-family HTH domain